MISMDNLQNALDVYDFRSSSSKQDSKESQSDIDTNVTKLDDCKNVINSFHRRVRNEIFL